MPSTLTQVLTDSDIVTHTKILFKKKGNHITCIAVKWNSTLPVISFLCGMCVIHLTEQIHKRTINCTSICVICPH